LLAKTNREIIMDASKLMFKPGLMKGQRILVTGGGTGLGKEMAEGLLALGAEVYICGRRGDVLNDAAKELNDKHAKSSGGNVFPYACDIRNHQNITDMVGEIWHAGPLTGLINNAAGQFISRTEDISPRGFDAIANIVFRGSFLMTQDVGKRWIEQKLPGSVVSILVTWVWNGNPFTVPSAMSKAGLNIMTKSLASEWARYRIRLNAIAPGSFPTEGASARLNPGARPAAERIDANSQDPMNMHRSGYMHELANLAAFMLAPGAEYLTGQTIAITGGSELPGRNSRLMEWTDEDWANARGQIQATNEADRAKRTV
jgi:NAD(P)-dependent dehydrogenase (short-subunit alcohol dehydrogenase family)